MAASTPAHDAPDGLTAAARYHDYRYASNPLVDGPLAAIPGTRFAARLHEQGPTQVVPLDTSAVLGCPGPATSPGLAASFVHVRPGEAIITDANATSQLFFAMRGDGTTRFAADPLVAGGGEIAWRAGDLFTLPAGSRAVHAAGHDAALYWVHDGPLLDYLGVQATRRMFTPTLYRREAIHEALDAVIRDPASGQANRLSVLLGHRLFPRTMTITHVIWAMYGCLPVAAVQAPHRHQSVAVDLVVDARPGCYTMVGRSLGADGRIKDGERFDWEPHGVFVTPPGLWHSHHNESGFPAHILPIQDAGLHTHLRTLDIRFARPTAGGSEVVEHAG
ncbi:MAG: cupin [Planctomycetia bacterium]|nr:cupin [Planctomycetia bacterium]